MEVTNLDQQYIKYLGQQEIKSQEKYDKYLIVLSSGAIIVSLVFLDRILKPESITNSWLISISWACWGIGIVAALFAFQCSANAFRKVLVDIHAGKDISGNPHPGGNWAKII